MGRTDRTYRGRHGPPANTFVVTLISGRTFIPRTAPISLEIRVSFTRFPILLHVPFLQYCGHALWKNENRMIGVVSKT